MSNWDTTTHLDQPLPERGVPVIFNGKLIHVERVSLDLVPSVGLHDHPCALCGRQPAEGFSSTYDRVNGERWFCHGDDLPEGETLTCYEQAAQTEVGTQVGPPIGEFELRLDGAVV